MNSTAPNNKACFGLFLVVLVVLSVVYGSYAIAEAIVGDPVLGADDPILGSKHDFTGLNERAGVVAMPGVAFSDYGYSCVYCHIPPEEAGAEPADFGGILEPFCTRHRKLSALPGNWLSFSGHQTGNT